MRKLISLGLLALLLSSLSTQLMAGHFEACEEPFKATYQDLGIYGLCNAWHNADTDEERANIEANVGKKTGSPPPWVVSCPCFSTADLDFAGGFEPLGCNKDPEYVGATYDANNLIFSAGNYSSNKSCFLKNYTDPENPRSVTNYSLTLEEVEICFGLVEALIDVDFINEGKSCNS